MSVQSISQLLDKCLFLLNPICFSSSAQLALEQPCFEETSQLRWVLVLFLSSKKHPHSFSLPRISKSKIHCDRGAAALLMWFRNYVSIRKASPLRRSDCPLVI